MASSVLRLFETASKPTFLAEESNLAHRTSRAQTLGILMSGSLPRRDLHFSCLRAKDIVVDQWLGNKTRGCVFTSLSQFSSASNNQSVLYS